jgi:hypothetical protein
MGGERNAYKILVGKPERKRPFDRLGCRIEDNLKMELKRIGCEDDWIHLARDRIPCTVAGSCERRIDFRGP